jgi:hypothetical protein
MKDENNKELKKKMNLSQSTFSLPCFSFSLFISLLLFSNFIAKMTFIFEQPIKFLFTKETVQQRLRSGTIGFVNEKIQT